MRLHSIRLSAVLLACALAPTFAITHKESSTPDARLLKAAEKGDPTEARAALQAGANPEAANAESLSALELADMRRNEIGSLSDRAPSIKAANRRLDIIKLLLDHGATIRVPAKVETARDQFGWAVLNDSLYFSRYDVAERLVRAGAPSDAVNLFSVMRAHPMTRKQREQRRWFDRTLSDKRVQGWLPQALCEAVAAPDSAYFVRRLLDIGADPNARTYTGHTPLTMAAMTGKTDIVRLLLARGADRSIPYRHPKSAYLMSTMNLDGKTPLEIATEQHRSDIAALLRKTGS